MAMQGSIDPLRVGGKKKIMRKMEEILEIFVRLNF